MGALLAFEIAASLQAENLICAGLFLASHCAPRLMEGRERLHLLPDAVLIQRLRALGGMDDRVSANPELLHICLATIRADLQASETYVVPDRPPLRCPLYVYAGRSDAWLEPSLLHLWKKESSSRSTVRVLAGGHFLVNGEEDLWLGALTADIRAMITKPVDHVGARTGAGRFD